MAKKSGTKLAAKKVSAKKQPAPVVAERSLPVTDTAEVSTPKWLVDVCNDLAVQAGAPEFQVDAFASSWNAKLPTYWDTKADGLKQDWTAHKSIYCNPPWKKDVLAKCVGKAIEAAKTGTVTVMLVPVWDQPWMEECRQHGRVHPVSGPVVFHRPDGTKWTFNNNKTTSILNVVVFGPNVGQGNGDTIRRRLTEEEKVKFIELEAKVTVWDDAMMAAAEALSVIQQEGFYLAEYPTFEAYVEAHWERTRQWAYDLIAWYEVNLAAKTLDHPLAMSAARLLKRQINNPELLAKIISEAQELAGKGRPTAETIAEAKAKLLPKPQARPADHRKRCFLVKLGGTDLGKVQSLSGIRGVKEITSDEDGLDLLVTDLDALFAKLAKLVAKNGGLRVSLGITKEEKKEGDQAK